MKIQRTGTALPARSFFYHYRRNAKKLKHKRLTNGQYRDFILEYHELITDECVNHRFEYKPPCRLGIFRIAKKKHIFVLDEKDEIVKKFVMIDWVETKKLWAKYPERFGKKFIFYTNPHTAGYYFRWEWSREIAAFHNMHYYFFIPTRQNKMKLHDKIMSTENYDAYEGVRKQFNG
jgi:hypothetical protein